MVAVLILHGRSDIDWATALANELAEHAPVRFQLTSSPPKVKLGPSVVRVGLWSDDSMSEGLAHTMSTLLGAEPTHSVLVRRGECASPPELDVAKLAEDIHVMGAREAAEQLRIAIPKVADMVVEIVTGERQRKVDAAQLQARRADDNLLYGALALLAVIALAFDWWGLRTMLAALFVR